MNENLTPWFPAKVKPVHEGVYEVDDKDGMTGTWYAFWDGKKFGYRTQNTDISFSTRYCETNCAKRVSWRGLAVKP